MPKITQKSIQIETNLKNINVLVDETKVLGVLLNIIGNAIYALQNNGKLTVKTEINTDNTASILIENNGIMIDKAVQKKIFEEGFTTKKEDGGSGLGLKIAKTSMLMMGGDLELVKSDKESTVFELKLQMVEEGR